MPAIIVLGQRRALTELDAKIAAIEEKRRELSAAIVRLSAAREDVAQLRALLRLTEDYLACLRQSRGILLWQLPPDSDLSPEVRSLAETCCPANERGAAGTRPRLVE
jgi:uncharacterized protein YecE (DUF72 family)